MTTDTRNLKTAPAGDFDPLDMSSYSLNTLPKRPLSASGRFFRIWGLPIAAVILAVFGYWVQFPILNPRQQIMFGLFAAALFLWICEAVPNYITSMLLICGLVLTGIVKAKPAMATLGDPVIWLNISAFILASAMVKTDLIKRIAQDPDDGEFALDLLMIAKYFERIGDHATNIAEWVIFSVTGEHKEG